MSSSHTNRLAKAKSPYLLQHQNNPVDWYEWSDEAFDKAKQLNRPVFLSIGYSTCHWCHVMAHESFENDAIAKQMNENFVSIKVDREERPDVDKTYMSFVQALSGHGGWPLSVFMTPDRSPFLGGTYFPPDDSPHQTGFRSVLKLVSDKWKNNPDSTAEHANYLVSVLKDAMKSKRYEGTVDAANSVRKCFNYLKESFDHTYGGFGISPKFPEPSNLLFLSNFYVLNKKKEDGKTALHLLTHTLNKIDAGGIHDVVGSGFHRYSVDAKWHVPHFEKMLYDQAQLLKVYSLAHISCENDYAPVIEDIVHYVNTCLKHKTIGCFYSAEDADSYPTKDSQKTVEGAFYVWTKDECEQVLYDFAPAQNENLTFSEIFATTYNVKDNGNVPRSSDPHGELKEKNVLIRTQTLDKLASEFRLTVPQFVKVLGDCYDELRKFRDQRPRPHLDSKIITSWNALMISGLITASCALPSRSSEYLEMAKKAFEFLAEKMRNTSDHTLCRSSYVDENGGVSFTENSRTGFADDYACFIQAAIDLYEATFEDKYLQLALDLQKVFDEKFYDMEEKSGYKYAPSDTKELILRSHSDQDGAEPSSNSVAALNLVRLSNLLGDKSFENKADDIFQGAGDLLTKNSHALPYMCIALEGRQNPSVQIVIVGVKEEDDEVCKEMLDVVKHTHLPNRTLIYVNKSKPNLVFTKNEHVKELIDTIKEPTAMVCRGTECLMPATSVQELKERLQEV
ncbi:Thioredox-DsbH domain-containing protein [Aphelenchoides besseyi]|nr:Thioredox-DsbH domain-containing protein [Aphelenchoides besseyi]